MFENHTANIKKQKQLKFYKKELILCVFEKHNLINITYKPNYYSIDNKDSPIIGFEFEENVFAVITGTFITCERFRGAFVGGS